MGRITVFTSQGCPYCKQVKAELAGRDLPYVEISYTEFPEVREKVFTLTSRMSTPQVFFNTRHIGGCDDTIALLKTWDRERRYSTARERYTKEIGQWPDPSGPALQIPAAGPPRVVESEDEFCLDRNGVRLPDGSSTSVMGITETLKSVLPCADLERKGSVFKKSFRGSEGVKAFEKLYQISTEEAVAFGSVLLRLKILHHVTDKHGFENNEDRIYRLQCYQTPYILNSYRLWDEPGFRNSPDQIVQRLSDSLLKIENDITDKHGMIHYDRAPRHDEFTKLEESLCELQSVCLEALLDEKYMLAFALNVYNIMLKFGFMKVGVPASESTRIAFLKELSFQIDGYVFSFHEWLDGILRGNKPSPFLLGGGSKVFSKKDPRSAFALKEIDPRIHFALNFWGRSCGIKHFSGENIDRELTIVAFAFCEDDANVTIIGDKNEVKLPNNFNLYKADFVGSSSDLPAMLYTYMVGMRKQNMQRLLLKAKGSQRITFKEQSWNSNVGDFVEYRSKSTAPNVHYCPIKKAMEERAMLLRRQIGSRVTRLSSLPHSSALFSSRARVSVV